MMEQQIYKRQWLIEARRKKILTLARAAWQLKISLKLLEWLENDRDVITHPVIADRIAELYGLSVEQRNALVAEKHRKEVGEKPRRRPGRPRKDANEAE